MEANNKIPKWDKMEKIEVNPNEEAERLSDLFIGNVKEKFEKNKITAMNPKQKAIKDHYIKAFIDSGMSEEEAEAKWNEVQHKFSADGWVMILRYDDNAFDHEGLLERDLVDVEVEDVYFWRLKSLRGIENNLGWKRIEDGLPEDTNSFYRIGFFKKNGEFYQDNNVFTFKTTTEALKDLYTHWMSVNMPNAPLY